MEYQLIAHSANPFVECLPHGGLIEGERDALDLVAACGEYGVQRLMVHAGNLTPDFYNLKTGLAGAVLLKFTTYTLKVALVLEPEVVGGRFAEMALEANRRNRELHIFYDRAAAEAWLVTD